MSLLKIPFLGVGALATYATLTPPQPKVAATERSKEASTFERIFSSIVRVYTGSFKLLMCSGALLETSVILASQFPSYPLSQQILESLVNGPASLSNKIGFSPLFLAGFGSATLGGFIRYQCYRTLGRFFTYEVAIRDDHQLVTEGPYSVVRHPSYTAAIACCVGLGVCYASPGAWLRECRILETIWGQAAMWLYLVFEVYGIASIVARTVLEDRLLRKQFGEQWDEWAKKVPYRMIPFIF